MTLDLETGRTTVIETGLDRSVDAAKWSGDRIAIQVDDQGQRKVLLQTRDGFDVISDKVSGVTLGRPYISGSFDVRDGVFALTEGSATRPADLVIRQGGTANQLTRVNEDVLGPLSLARAERLVYPSSFDGTRIGGWVLSARLRDSKRYPLILELHGGPHLAYGPHFSAELQLMAAAGYLVFYDNYRGSSSYGKAFGNLLQGKYSSTEDFQDHMSGIDRLVEKGKADPNNLFVAGGSAGGIATAYAMPDRSI